MNKKLIAILMLGALSACGQANSGAQEQQTKAPKAQAEQKIETVQKAELKVTHVDAAKSAEIMQSRPELVVIDVRTPGEFAAGHIDGAINIDFKNANFATEIAKLDGAQDYLIHCRSGGRSGRSLEIFKTEGFSHIIHMDGGMIAWNKANLPTVK